MIRIWVNPSDVVPGGQPILVGSPAGLYRTDLVEIRDAQGALVATIKYSQRRTPDRRTRVWVEVEPQPTANVSITDRRLPVEDRAQSPQEE